MCNFIKRLQHRYFLEDFAKFLRIVFFYRTTLVALKHFNLRVQSTLSQLRVHRVTHRKNDFLRTSINYKTRAKLFQKNLFIETVDCSFYMN